MLEKPSISEEKIRLCAETEFALSVTELTFLPLGADLNTAVYSLRADDDQLYFLKLRQGPFSAASVALPHFLVAQGIPVIPPRPAKSGRLWAELEAFKVILYPFVKGQDGYAVDLSDSQWVELGQAFHRIHSVELPPALAGLLRPETYPPAYRHDLRLSLEHLPRQALLDAVSRETAAILNKEQPVILALLDRAERLAASLRNRSSEFCLCHADVHAGNLLIEPGGAFYIVDWDEALLAPKERDLMSIGADLFGAWRSPDAEERLFYQGYGRTALDRAALAYYRCERIIVDLAVEYRQIFESEPQGEDREQALKYLLSNFEPGGTIALAQRTPAD